MVNDISIIAVIITVFVLLGVLLPFINNDLTGVAGSNLSATGLQDNVGEEVENVSTISAFSVALSILKMFFWTFGTLPFWLDAIFVIFRILLAFIIARNIWIGGGG